MQEICPRCRMAIDYEFNGADRECPECGWEREAAMKWQRTVGNTRSFRKSVFGIEYRERDFCYMGRSYSYSDIVDLKCDLVTVRHTLNFVPDGRSTRAYLSVHFRRGRGVSFVSIGGRTLARAYALGAEQQGMLAAYRTLFKAALEFSCEFANRVRLVGQSGSASPRG